MKIVDGRNTNGGMGIGVCGSLISLASIAFSGCASKPASDITAPAASSQPGTTQVDQKADVNKAFEELASPAAVRRVTQELTNDPYKKAEEDARRLANPAAQKH